MSKVTTEHGALENTSETDQDSYGCPHYKRKCEFYTPCCQKTYRCRFCHDANETHVLQREDVQEIVCSQCSTRQGVTKDCKNCGTVFGKYFCQECKLYDGDDKEQFHCDGCGICRIGGRDNFFHCPTCDMCLPLHLEGKHRCIENLSRANCPICQEDIHTSREPSRIPPCNHLIHKTCFDQLVKSAHYYCPVCSHSLVDMREMWKIMDTEIQETPLPAVYQNLHSMIYCRDCLKMSNSPFHFLGIKCGHCCGYNTVREKGPLFRRIGDKFIEANLASDQGVQNVIDVIDASAAASLSPRPNPQRSTVGSSAAAASSASTATSSSFSSISSGSVTLSSSPSSSSSGSSEIMSMELGSEEESSSSPPSGSQPIQEPQTVAAIPSLPVEERDTPSVQVSHEDRIGSTSDISVDNNTQRSSVEDWDTVVLNSNLNTNAAVNNPNNSNNLISHRQPQQPEAGGGATNFLDSFDNK